MGNACVVGRQADRRSLLDSAVQGDSGKVEEVQSAGGRGGGPSQLRPQSHPRVLTPDVVRDASPAPVRVHCSAVERSPSHALGPASVSIQQAGLPHARCPHLLQILKRRPDLVASKALTDGHGALHLAAGTAHCRTCTVPCE